jgi:hypothetical protein
LTMAVAETMIFIVENEFQFHVRRDAAFPCLRR